MKKEDLENFDFQRPISKSYIEKKDIGTGWNLDETFLLMLKSHLDSRRDKLLININYNSDKNRYDFEIYGLKNCVEKK